MSDVGFNPDKHYLVINQSATLGWAAAVGRPHVTTADIRTVTVAASHYFQLVSRKKQVDRLGRDEVVDLVLSRIGEHSAVLRFVRTQNIAPDQRKRVVYLTHVSVLDNPTEPSVASLEGAP